MARIVYEGPVNVGTDLDDATEIDLQPSDGARFGVPTGSTLDGETVVVHEKINGTWYAAQDASAAAYDGPTNTEMTSAFTEIKGAGWSSSTDTLEKIRDASGGGSSSVVVSPMTATIAQRINGTIISAYLNDTSELGPISVTDASDAAVDLSGKTLRFVVEASNGSDRGVVEDADITVSGASNSQFSFSPTSGMVSVLTSCDLWSLRDVDDGNRVLVHGQWRVIKAAIKD